MEKQQLEKFTNNVSHDLNWFGSVMEYLCHKWQRTCSVSCNHNSVIAFPAFLTWFFKLLSRQMPLIIVDQELKPFRVLPPGFNGGSSCSIIGFLCCALSTIVCPFILGHFIVLIRNSPFLKASSNFVNCFTTFHFKDHAPMNIDWLSLCVM